MGSTFSSGDIPINMNKREPFEVTDDTGYIFCKKYCIPEELLTIILSYVEPEDLVHNCRRVCKTWCNVIDTQVWRLKFDNNDFVAHKVQHLPWYACYWIFMKKNLWGRNLIKNSCGQDKFKHWTMVANGGDCWRIEKPPVGSEAFPEDIDEEVKLHDSCFATSYQECIKEQLVDLAAEGASAAFMDILQPDIIVSEWYSGRFDCLSTYTAEIGLYNEDKTLVYNKSHDPLSILITNRIGSADGWAWHKVSHVFKNYGPGIRYVLFRHGGKDRQFWAGHYGSKMTGASVTLRIPDSLYESETMEDHVEEQTASPANQNESSSQNVVSNHIPRRSKRNRRNINRDFES